MDSKNRLFRRSRFGGFNRDDVIDYIEKMKNEFFEYKSDVEKTLSVLRQRISELETENENLIKAGFTKTTAENEVKSPDPVNGINEATDHLKMVADELCDSLNKFLDKLSESSFTVTVEAAAQEAVKLPGDNNVVSDILDSVFSSKTEPNEDSSNESVLDSVLPSYLFE